MRIQGLALVGVLVLPADDDTQILASWSDLPPDVEVVILTTRAGEVLGRDRAGPLTVVMPP